MKARAGALAAVLALCACTTGPALPGRPVPAGPQITVRAAAVPLSPEQPAQARIGGFVYAGGLHLTSPDTSRLHGLSDLTVAPDGRLAAVSDDGDLFEARLVLDRAGRLRGLAQPRLSPLAAEDGQPLSALGKRGADAEGLAEVAGGARLVSLEREHRVLLYPAAGGPPRRAPAPDAAFPENEGMEGLAAAPEAGADAYLVGGEESLQVWLCRLAAGCAPDTQVARPEADAGLVAIAALPGGRRAYLLRAFSVLKGVRVTLRITEADGGVLDELRLTAPYTVDNLEGVAALPQADGSVRFYLLSDDNFSKLQRTLLLAFDWRPQPGRTP